ncbi:MAG: Hpt domain-containing protein [Curvibacter sp.]|nr:Hpt domain-containing protein [Curvibacter sp.]
MRLTESAAAAGPDTADKDLGPLAWVLDELRKSLDGSIKALRRFVREAEQALGDELATLDVTALRLARQQMHQATGALEMVGMQPVALMLRSMESVVQKFVQRPELCTEDNIGVLERASFAVSEYLETVLAGHQVSPVGLFPQFRDVQQLLGVERVHPADLWPQERRMADPALPADVAPLAYGLEVRSRFDQAVLKLVKGARLGAAQDLCRIAAGLAESGSQGSRLFWKVASGFFEGLHQGLIPLDVYVKRVISRVLAQYTALARGEAAVSERLFQDLLFYCAQARVDEPGKVPYLDAVREAYGLARHAPADYESRRFGRFDPSLLTQARKRIAAATDTWSALAGGDRNKLKSAVDQFGLVGDSLKKLHPDSVMLTDALQRAVDATAQSGEPPSPALAMEVATAVLYLQAVYQDLDADEAEMAQRSAALAQRVLQTLAGGHVGPLEPWMEELYRKVSDRQTMGSVVDELRATLGEAEKGLDAFFRNPADAQVLAEVPALLSQMRGVLSVLGLDQAAHATMRMRDSVERLMVDEVTDDAVRAGTFERLGNSLGSLGFLIDMLSYQGALARKLFVYDEDLGELKLVTGRLRRGGPAAQTDEDEAREADVSLSEVLAPSEDFQSELPQTVFGDQTPAMAEAGRDEGSVAIDLPLEPVAAPEAAQPELQEDDLLDVFLEEAREVFGHGAAAIAALERDGADLTEQTTLRRAFHTLKGSSRMVGLNEFGEAAWAMEQLHNAWLADQKPADAPLLQLSAQALRKLGAWVEDIAAHQAGHWQAQPFRDAADALRLEGRLSLLDPPAPSAEPVATDLPQAGDDADRPLDFQSTSMMDDASFGKAEQPLADLQVDEIDFAQFEAATDVMPLSELPPAHWDAPSPAVPVSPAAEPQPGDLSDPFRPEAFAPVPDAAAPGPLLDLPELAGLGDMPEVEPPVPEPGLDLGPAQVDEAQPSFPASDAESEAGLGLPEFQLDFPEDAVSVGGDAEAPRLPDPLADAEAEAAAEPALEPLLPEAADQTLAVSDDESVKVIGDLRLGIPLYNVYLNEADEWSRRLQTTLAEWALELHVPVPDPAVALAHSLAGSSATVGFQALSGLARTLEHALQHVQLQSQGTPDQAQAFVAAGDEIRRLLHQFAAGFLKEPQAEILRALEAILATEADTAMPWGYEPGEDLEPLQGVAAEEMPALLEQGVPTGFGEAAPAASNEPDFGSAAEAPASPEAEAPEAAALPIEPEPPSEPEAQPAPELPAPAPESLDEAALQLPDTLESLATEPARQPALLEPTAAQSLTLPELDDDIDAVDAVDPDLFPIFDEEAQDLMPRLASSLRQWQTGTQVEQARPEVLRLLHTLKGSARLAGALRLGEMAHRMESAIEELDESQQGAALLDPLMARFDAMQASLDALRSVGQLASAEPAGDGPMSADAAPQTDLPALAAPARAVVAPSALQQLPIRVSGNQSVRVRAQLLDRLVNQAGEVMISRSRLEARMGQLRGSLGELTGNLDRLRQQLRDIELQAESQMQSRLALSKDSAAGFDPLEFDRFTRVQELTRMMAESVNDVATVQRTLQRTVEGTEDDLVAQARQARELQRDLLRTRMVEFEGISERLYAIARQAAKETGKQIKLDIEGGSIEMDRGVLDRMTPSFEHLLRNAVAHGIESPEQREAAGKPAAGHIVIRVAQTGNDMSVEFADDGAGLNLERIRERALAQGLLEPGQTLSDDEAAHLIFMPGFTTVSEVTGLAGRGIGMDVVRTEVNALGGRIQTETAAGQGSRFQMVLPLTTAVTQVVMLRAGQVVLGVPSGVVEIVRRVGPGELEEAYRSGQFDLGIESVPFYWAGSLLQTSRASQDPAARTRPVVIFRSASQRVAVHVDEVLGNQEVVVKNLGPQLSRLPGLAGMSVLASGAVVLIYNPVALANVYGEQIRALASEQAAPADAQTEAAEVLPAVATQSPLVLVVDDSITVRRVTQRLLQREGYRVALAADGLQALERLQEERPAVVLSDIEMPRMDGFDLTRNIRHDDKLRELPIIMITSRIAAKHREHAMELGANHYLGKPYSEEELLSLVRRYTADAELN